MIECELIVPPSDSDLEKYKRVSVSFSDYTRFEDPNSTARQEAKKRFMTAEDYVPQYSYPKLTSLWDGDEVRQSKTILYEAALELEVGRRAAELLNDEYRTSELELYRAFNDLRLQRVMLVEAAHALGASRTSSAVETAKETFNELNAELYGEVNSSWYLGMMESEREKIEGFSPTNEDARKLVGELKEIFSNIERTNTVEPAIMDERALATFNKVLLDRYQEVLSAVPNTGDDVRYDANQCAEIMNKALVAGGLYDQGWRAVVDPSKSNPSTRGGTSRISLPSNTSRTAQELRRLILHEQEVHARRGQNARDLGSDVLFTGTADYVDVEEGLGVLFECVLEGNFDNPSFQRARERYITIGLALGVNGTPRDARETFEVLWRILALNDSKNGEVDEKIIKSARDRAYRHIENAYRGTNFAMKGVVFRKMKVYYEGLKKNADYFSSHQENINNTLDVVMMGKYNHVDPRESHVVTVLVSHLNTDIRQS